VIAADLATCCGVPTMPQCDQTARPYTEVEAASQGL